MEGGGGCPGPAVPLRADRGQHDGQNHLTTEDGVDEGEAEKQKLKVTVMTVEDVKTMHRAEGATFCTRSEVTGSVSSFEYKI